MAFKKRPEDKIKSGAPEFQYSKELAERICHAIATSPDSLKTVCEKNPDFPKKDTIVGWRVNKPDFAAMYFEAKRRQVQEYVEESFELADFSGEDPGAVAKKKMQIDLRKWYASRLVPRLYGDRLAAEEKSADASVDTLKKTIEHLQSLIDKNQKDY